MSKPKPIAQVVAVEPAGPDGHGVNWLGGKPPKPGDLLYRAEDINQGRAGLREAAQLRDHGSLFFPCIPWLWCRRRKS